MKELDAVSIANTILNSFAKLGVDFEKLVGQGYDGCSTMAGKVGGVQAKITATYPKAAFVHCASHKLNLVVNYLNKVSEITNSVGTIKAILRFFRESPKRRSLVPNIPLLCETRWTAKYKSIRVFTETIDSVFEQLSKLATVSSGKTRQEAHQLESASSTTTFLICMTTISVYSAR